MKDKPICSWFCDQKYAMKYLFPFFGCINIFVIVHLRLILFYIFRKKKSTSDELKQIKYWRCRNILGVLLRRCYLSLCHLLPDWRQRLSYVGGGSPVVCCRLPPAGAQRSLLSWPSPPPPSHTPLTWSPEDTAAPSSHLWERMGWES